MPVIAMKEAKIAQLGIPKLTANGIIRAEVDPCE